MLRPTGQDFVEGGVQAGKARAQAYTANHYHQPSDQWKAEWSFVGMKRDLGLLYGLRRDLAESNDWPNWSQDTEFRAARDQSAAKRK